MAKRRRKQPEETILYRLLERRRAIFWTIAVVISLLFGYTWGYQQAVEGDTLNAIVRTLAYGGGAFIVISVSYYLNRKLKGL
jgi:hypothetical protein